MIKLKVKFIGEHEIDNHDSFKISYWGVIPNKVYEVLSIEHDWYRIVDESGEDYLYSPKKFEVVDENPPAPVLM